MEAKFIEEIKEVFEIDNRDINPSDAFREYDEWDSLCRLSLIAMLDDNYEVSIEDDTFKKLITIEDLYNEVQKRK